MNWDDQGGGSAARGNMTCREQCMAFTAIGFIGRRDFILNKQST